MREGEVNLMYGRPSRNSLVVCQERSEKGAEKGVLASGWEDSEAITRGRDRFGGRQEHMSTSDKEVSLLPHVQSCSFKKRAS